MKNAATAEPNKHCLKHHQISLIILRFEVDDLHLTNQSKEAQLLANFNQNSSVISVKKESIESNKAEYISNTSNLNIYETLKFERNNSKEDLEDLTQDREGNLNNFIGKRESRLFSIETYYFNNNNSRHTEQTEAPMHQANLPTHQDQETANNQQLVNNALTMQKALETAYNDWNKEKESKPGSELVGNDKSDAMPPSSMNKIDSVTKQVEELSTSNRNSQIASETETNKSKEKPNHAKSESKKKSHHKSSTKLPNKETELKSSVLISTSDSTTASTKVEADQNTSEIAYIFGNPTVDLVKGFIHIYKSCQLSVLDEKSIESAEDFDTVNLTQTRSQMLCMIGVPNSISCNELLDFVMPFNENMQFMRILRDSYPNQYMVLLKFTNQKDADLFYCHNNNKPFNSIEDSNLCHLAFVERVETINSSKGAAKPIPGFIEMPACYICLERMDESLYGVISILCNHSFHTNCLVKWGDTCCPVCRYSQTPDYADIDNACTECGSNENLWICLICGYIGCGRYAGGHAHNHFKETQHTYSMELGNNKVWDYAADNYVHRLIQNKTDGKLVQFDENSREVNRDEKVDSITLEYTYLLTMQLDSQRLFFEERLNKMEDKANFQLEETEMKLVENMNESVKLKENLNQLTKEKNNLDKKYTAITTKFNKLQSELNEERELNKCLTSNQELYQNKLAILEEKLKKSDEEKSSEIEDLQSQLRDLMFYLDAQSKMSQSVASEEIQDSQMVIQQDEAAEASAATPKPSLSNSAKMANRRKRK